MKSQKWIRKQLFLLALTAGFLYFAAPATDIVTIYAMDFMSGDANLNTIGNDASDFLSSFSKSSHPINRNTGPPAKVDMESLSPIRKSILVLAQTYLGTMYTYGGNTREGIDCSGLVQQVYRQNKIRLPRTVKTQCNIGTPLKMSELLPGDLIFFRKKLTHHRPSHVGIYMGNQQFLHAPKTGLVVKMSSLNTYYRRHFWGARRVVHDS